MHWTFKITGPYLLGRVGDNKVKVWGSNFLHSVQLVPLMTDLMTNIEDRLNF